MASYVLEPRYNSITPLWGFDDLDSWARSHPNMYTVSPTLIMYYDSRALAWFILRWGPPINICPDISDMWSSN